MVVCCSPKVARFDWARQHRTGLGFTRASALHVANQPALPASRGLTGAFIPRVVRSTPSPGPGSSPLQAGKPHRALVLAQWEWQSSKWLQGLLPMSSPHSLTRCIILKSWAPDAIPDIISVEKINTATRAWSLTGQADHEHWQDLRR